MTLLDSEAARFLTREQVKILNMADRNISEREVEVLQLIADGNTNQKIGEKLGISGLTVKAHLAHLTPKLRTGDRAAMVAIAFRLGLID